MGSSAGKIASEEPSALAEELEQLRSALVQAQQDLELGTLTQARRIEELEAQVKARDEFLAVAAHELRNPMGGIALSVQALRRSAHKWPDSAGHALREKLESLDRRIAQYIGRATTLLDVARLATGRFQPELDRVNLSELISQMLEDLSDDFQRAGSTVSVELDEGVVGQWDPMGLEQAIANLLSNALKYGAGAPIEVSLTHTPAHALVEVKDHGIGISEDDQTRIFQKFERAVMRRQHGGFGIGLWVTRQIVEGLGGQIRVLSQPGEGATFLLELPLQSAREDK